MGVVYSKLIIAFVLLVLFVITLKYKDLISNKLSGVSWINPFLLWVVMRLIPYVAIYWVLDFAISGDVDFFYKAAEQTLNGKIVYKDFWQPYSPFFSYVNTIPLIISSSPKLFMLWMLIFELFAVLVTNRIFSSFNIYVVLLYFLLPSPFVLSVFAGQEDITIWLFSALAIFVMRKYRSETIVGVVMAVGLITTKVLFAFPILFWLLLSKQKLKFLIGLLVVGIPASALTFYFAGLSVFEMFNIGDYPFAPNLVSVLSPIVGGIDPASNFWNYGALVACLLITLIFLSRWLKNKAYQTTFVSVFMLFFLLLFIWHKNSIPNYSYIICMPLMACFANRFKFYDWFWFLNFIFISAFFSSLWYTAEGGFYTSFQTLNSLQWTEYLLQLIYLVSLIALTFRMILIFNQKPLAQNVG